MTKGISEGNICLRCIGDKVLRALLRKEARRKQCRFCGNRRIGVSLDILAEHINRVYRNFFALGQWYSTPGSGSDDRTYSKQEGSSPNEIIQEIAKVEYEVAEALVEILSDGECRDVNDGGEPYYEHSFNYVQRELPPVEQQWIWSEFHQRIKHHRRYFDDEGKNLLQSLLGNLGELKPSPIFILRPKGHCGTIFRARRASNREEANRLCSDAKQNIGPPQPDKALAGRMNAYGIPVFYGAFSEGVAIAEIRPYVGGIVVVGKFEVIRKLKLLDLGRFVDAPFIGSMFTSNFVERVSQVNFLNEFLSIISRPILPHEEPLEYIATQAVSEYLANQLGFDGIVYPSAQLGDLESEDDANSNWLEGNNNDGRRLASKNVALFQAIGIIEDKPQIPKNKKEPKNTSVPDLKMEDLLCLRPVIVDDQEISPISTKPPSLRYVEGSAKVVKVKGMKIDYDYDNGW